MVAAHRRHDKSDDVWERLRPLLPGGEGKRGRPAHDNRQFIDAVCWIRHAGAMCAANHQVRDEHNIGYFGASMSFGSMEHSRVLRSKELFAKEVMPKFRQ